MKKIKQYFVFTVVIIALIFTLCGCSPTKFEQDDFELKVESVEINGNQVAMQIEFRNNSYKNGWVLSGGASGKPSSIIRVCCKNSDGESMWDYPAVAINHWIRCKQKIKNTDTFELEEGIYTIEVCVSLYCNNEKDHFYYESESITIEIEKSEN